MYTLLAMPDANSYKNDLEARFPDISFYTALSEPAIGDHVEKMDILITVYRVADELLKEAARLKWIQVTTSGVNYLLSRPSLKRHVIITTCRGVHGPQMSEMTFLLMLALNRNFPQVVHNQDQRLWERWPGRLLYGKKAGILGVGVIGEEIARKCKAFGMTVFGINTTKREVASVDFFYSPEELLRVAGEVDYLIVAARSTPENEKIINAEVLAAMKPTAYLINIARGEMVDEEALIQALEGGKIAGAALDALSSEPLPKDHPLWKTKNLIITPHVGGMSDNYREQVMPIIEENLRRFLQGERRDLINYVER
ncbi:MAG: D-2-hydroxyacid dehydrogenase [Syntrophales bacterium]|jgi:phosphoglycerate dehydrogenase-like enzyme|nr:D-2-hydroxyacid dehydrogenase [Syntrophales bacterium]